MLSKHHKLSNFRCYTIEAAMEFFGMDDIADTPTKNHPNFAFMNTEDQKQNYFQKTFDKFIDEYVTAGDAEESEPSDPGAHTNGTDDGSADLVDNLRNYSRNILQYFFVLEDYRDAVKEGDGKRIAQIHKDFLLYFKTDKSYNPYAIEMMVNITQNEVLLSEQEAHRSIWNQTVNWKGGERRNVEADLMQENRNSDHKSGIKMMGANKTRKAVERLTKASGGKRKIVENYDEISKVAFQSTSHTHRSSDRDETLIRQDLRRLRPFKKMPGRRYPSFPEQHAHPLEKVNFVELHYWLTDHMQNMAKW